MTLKKIVFLLTLPIISFSMDSNPIRIDELQTKFSQGKEEINNLTSQLEEAQKNSATLSKDAEPNDAQENLKKIEGEIITLQSKLDSKKAETAKIEQELQRALSLNKLLETATTTWERSKILHAYGSLKKDDYNKIVPGFMTEYVKPALRDGWVQFAKGLGEGIGKGSGEVVNEVGKILVVPAAQGLADCLYGTSLEQEVQLRTLRSQMMAQKMPFIQQKIHGYQETIDLCVKELSHDHLDAATRAFWTEEKTKAENELRKLEQRSQKHTEHELENIDFTLNLLERNTHKGLAETIASWWNKAPSAENKK